jgi:putative glycosyltransferase
MKISIVSTLYKSKIFLDRFVSQIIEALRKIECSEFEIIFVNDGSPDDSMAHLIAMKKEIPQIVLIDLSRNFGHHYAIQAGLNYASGDYVFLIDNDLETSPLILVDFYNELKSNLELDVVYGYQAVRKGSFIEKYFGKLFWRSINKLSDTKIPHNILTERLMTKQYVKALLSLGDANLFIGGMMHWVGFNQKGIAVKKALREGKSTYSLKKRAELMLHAVTSFSGKPLEWLFYVGLTISFFSIAFIFFLVGTKMVYKDSVQLGWTSIIAINILILGIITTFLGIIGLYLFRVFRQVQGRPNSVIKKIYE